MDKSFDVDSELSVFKEALRNALSQLDRLKRYRTIQKTRYDQLEERLDYVNSELDISVDALRYHQSNFEAQKQRMIAEMNQLRHQLAKANVMLDQYKCVVSKQNIHNLSTKISGNDLNVVRASSLSPTFNCSKSFDGNDILISESYDSSSSSSPTSSNSLNDLRLQLFVAQNELVQLRSKLNHQRDESDRELVRLRFQLDEVMMDARSNRLPSTRPSNLTNPNADGYVKLDHDVCGQCVKLQRLVEILQTKYNDYCLLHQQKQQQSKNCFPDLITHSKQLSHIAVQTNDSLLVGFQSTEMNDSRGMMCLDVSVSSIDQEVQTESFKFGNGHRSEDVNCLVSNAHDFDWNTRESCLLNRVKVAEQEASMAIDQLKSSNLEFLNLRERLSHATIERAHLKAIVEDSNEQFVEK